MNYIVLNIALVFIWIAVLSGAYQRLIIMPKWFADPPASFELIRKQNRKVRIFWIPLSSLYVIFVVASLIFNWRHSEVRLYLISAIACFLITGILSGSYFIREVISFSQIPIDAPATTGLINRVKFWLRWTTLRDVLQFIAAILVTAAYLKFEI